MTQLDYLVKKFEQVESEWNRYSKKCNSIWDKPDYDYNLEKYESELEECLSARDMYFHQMNLLEEILKNIPK